MKTWDGKSKGNPLGYRIFYFLINNLGLGSAYFLLYFVSFFYLVFSRKSSLASYKFFRYIRKDSLIKAWFNVYKSYYVFGQTLIDKFAILAGKGDWFSFDSKGHDILDRLNENASSAILISGHLGNWEVAGHLLKGYDMPVNVIMHDAEHEAIKQLLEESHSVDKYKVIGIKADHSHLLLIHQAIKKGELLCMHGDRFMKEEQAVQQTFPWA